MNKLTNNSKLNLKTTLYKNKKKLKKIDKLLNISYKKMEINTVVSNFLNKNYQNKYLNFYLFLKFLNTKDAVKHVYTNTYAIYNKNFKTYNLVRSSKFISDIFYKKYIYKLINLFFSTNYQAQIYNKIIYKLMLKNKTIAFPVKLTIKKFKKINLKFNLLSDKLKIERGFSKFLLKNLIYNHTKSLETYTNYKFNHDLLKIYLTIFNLQNVKYNDLYNFQLLFKQFFNTKSRYGKFYRRFFSYRFQYNGSNAMPIEEKQNYFVPKWANRRRYYKNKTIKDFFQRIAPELVLKDKLTYSGKYFYRTKLNDLSWDIKRKKKNADKARLALQRYYLKHKDLSKFFYHKTSAYRTLQSISDRSRIKLPPLISFITFERNRKLKLWDNKKNLTIILNETKNNIYITVMSFENKIIYRQQKGLFYANQSLYTKNLYKKSKKFIYENIAKNLMDFLNNKKLLHMVQVIKIKGRINYNLKQIVKHFMFFNLKKEGYNFPNKHSAYIYHRDFRAHNGCRKKKQRRL